MRKALKVFVLVVVSLAALGVLDGCGGEDKLTSDSKCSDFSQADSDTQKQAVGKINADEGGGNAATPLGLPNVVYLCAKYPDITLGKAIAMTNGDG